MNGDRLLRARAGGAKWRLWGLLLVVLAVAAWAWQTRGGALPAPDVDAPLARERGRQTAVLAGGCFWGVEAVFEHVRGVTRAVSGYAGGTPSTASYDLVSGGRTGHAESVEVTFDPSVITYGQLLRVFFSVAHDPTEHNRQGPDVGPQYRSAIFFADADQQRIAAAYIAQLDRAGVLRRPIATEVTRLDGFHAAEEYHQDYAARNPDDPYIRINDAPKVAALRRDFPALFVGR